MSFKVKTLPVSEISFANSTITDSSVSLTFKICLSSKCSPQLSTVADEDFSVVTSVFWVETFSLSSQFKFLFHYFFNWMTGFYFLFHVQFRKKFEGRKISGRRNKFLFTSCSRYSCLPRWLGFVILSCNQLGWLKRRHFESNNCSQ